MKYAVQLLTAWSIRLGCTVEQSHIKGEHNTKADALSREQLDGFDPRCRVPVALDSILTVGSAAHKANPRDAPWPARLKGLLDQHRRQ